MSNEIFGKIGAAVEAKLDKLVDGFTDPADQLDYAYQRQLEQAKALKGRIVEVRASRNQLADMKNGLVSEMEGFERSAKSYLQNNKKELAAVAAESVIKMRRQVTGLETAITQIKAEEDILIDASERLDIKIRTFRAEKEIIKARLKSAGAQADLAEQFSGISTDFADIGNVVNSANERIARMQSRTSAITTLTEEGVIGTTVSEVPAVTSDEVEAELNRIMGTGA